MSVQAVLSSLSGRQVEAFYALLLSTGNYTFLPELYDVFGRETTIKFLEVFAGCRLSVPRVEQLEKLARDVAIYIRIDKASSDQQPIIIHTLAEEYELDETRVRAIYAKTKVKLEVELGLQIMPRSR